MPAAREVVILGGCVVEPPAVSGERERFVLELDRDARAQVTLYTKPGETLPALHYGQNIELDAKVRPPRNFGNPGAFDYRRFLARQDIYWTASAAAGSVRILPGRCGNPLSESGDGPARVGPGAHRTPLSRRRVPDGDDAGDSDRAVLPTAEGLDRAVPLHRDVSRAGDFRDSRGGAGRLLPVRAAHLLRAGERGAVCDRAGGVAVCAGHGVAGALRAFRGGAHAVHDRGLFLSRAAHHESAGGGRAGISAARPGPVVRRQFPAHVPGGGIPGSLRRARRSPPLPARWRTDCATLPIRGRDLHLRPAPRSSASRCACWPRPCTHRCGRWRGRPAWSCSFTRSCSRRRWCNSAWRCPWWSTFTAWDSRGSRPTPSSCR